jgi:hypothetical protein
MICYALTPGYETYEGLGWYGCIESRVSGDRNDRLSIDIDLRFGFRH